MKNVTEIFVNNARKGFVALFFSILCISSVYAGKEDRVVEITLVGVRGSGKTALLETLAGKNFDFSIRQDTTKSTVGREKVGPLIYENAMRELDSKYLYFEIYDTPGQDTRGRLLEVSSTVNTSKIIAILSDVSKVELGERREKGYDGRNPGFKGELSEWASFIAKKNPSAMKIFVGSKIDKANKSQIFEAEGILCDIKKRYPGSKSVLLSAICDQNLDDFANLAKDIVEKNRLFDSLVKNDNFEPRENRKRCCNLI